MTKKVKPGDEVYVVQNRGRGNPYYAVVVKVGTKWAQIGMKGSEHTHLRMCLKTWRLDGGHYTSPGDCYPSKEVYEEQLREAAIKKDFLRKVGRYDALYTVSAERIRQAAEILGIELEAAQ